MKKAPLSISCKTIDYDSLKCSKKLISIILVARKKQIRLFLRFYRFYGTLR